MQSFLQHVAEDLFKKVDNDLSRTTIVFPNRRAGLFMNESLMRLTDGAPLWAPQYVTISDLFHALAPEIAINDPVDTTLRIVALYQQFSGQQVAVDQFYGWAERILADFDDVDKNMADANGLFRHISELKDFDDTSFLTPEQVKELQHFFAGFDVTQSGDLRDKYRMLWDILGDIYRQLNADLEREGLAYEGAMYRKVIERLKADECADFYPHVDHFVFVGFNVLDRVEQELFSILRKKGKAWFYWDYDEYYLKSYYEASLFMRENLKMFPNELPATLFNRMATATPCIEMIAASTEAIQAQYVAPWLEANLTADAKQTAVVLCNENLLQPVLHALPDKITDLNVTKGFPLAHTNVAAAIEQKFGEWERQPPTSSSVVDLLDNLTAMVEEQGHEFVNREGYSLDKFEDVLQGEAYYQMFTILNRFRKVLASYASNMGMTIVTLRRLIHQMVRQNTVPFHGEPAVGLQIMGVLETRCIDFDHIIMLSVNDGVLPKKSADNSFIPYLLRKAYGLTTPERKTAVYAYYFYRLLQRASHITMTYNTSTEGMCKGEMSRFMTQLLVEWPGRIAHATLDSTQRIELQAPTEVPKPQDMIQRIMKDYDTTQMPTLSPTALTTYQRCQVKFYYNFIRNISEPQDDSKVMKPNTFGTIFHCAAENVYKQFLGVNDGRVNSDQLLAIADNSAALARYVRQAFEICKVTYRPLEASVITTYLEGLLRYDARQDDLCIKGTERKADCFVTVQWGGESVKLRIKGVIDRLDLVRLKDGSSLLRVVDYKTSASTKLSEDTYHVENAMANTLEDIYAIDGKHSYMLQTLLYGKMLKQMAKDNKPLEKLLRHPVAPTLIYSKFTTNPNYQPYLSIGGEDVLDYNSIETRSDALLQQLLDDIFDIDKPFTPTDAPSNCKNCPYRRLCFM